MIMANNEQTIRDFDGRIVGYITTDASTQKQTARDFYRIILGYYEPKLNITRDFGGRIIAQGNVLASLIWLEENKRQAKNKK